MGVFGRKSELAFIKCLAKEIRNRNVRESFDGARVMHDSECVLKKYPSLSDLGVNIKPSIKEDYIEITRYVTRTRRSRTGRHSI